MFDWITEDMTAAVLTFIVFCCALFVWLWEKVKGPWNF